MSMCLLSIALPLVAWLMAGEDPPAVAPNTAPVEEFAEPVCGPLSLEQAAALALAHNPRLRVFPWDVRAAEARALQAAMWPNPELSFEFEDARLSEAPEERTRTTSLGAGGIVFEQTESDGAPSGFREAEFTLRVSQMFLLGGKRQKAVALAERERDAAAWDYEIGRTDVLRDVARAYVAVLAGQDRVAERQRILDLAQTVERTIRARAEAGKVSPIEDKRAAVLTAAAQIDFDRARRVLEQARIALAATWGATTPMFDSVTGDLHNTSELPALDTLLSRSVANPDLKRWQFEIARREAALALTQSNRVPDLTASLGLVSQGVDGRNGRGIAFGSDGIGLSRSSTSFDRSRENRFELEFSIPLPIFNRNEGNIREAEHLLSKADDERHVTLTDVETAIASGYQMAMAAYDEIVTLDRTTLPLADDAFESVRIGYDEGKFGYLEVLDAQRTLFDLRIQLVEAYAEYHHAVVEIERLLGEPLWPAAERFGTSTQENSDEID